MRIKSIAVEAGWLIGTLVLIILAGLLTFHKPPLSAFQLDIQVHDTYYVFRYPGLLMAIFVTTALIIYALKETSKRYSRVFPNLILLALLLAEMLLIAWVIITLSNLEVVPVSGWVIYPPLKGEPEIADTSVNESVVWFNRILKGVEGVLGIALILIGMKTRKLLQTRKHIG
jgi:heme/copper-type cytochrome/quinol oxidase subunit 1